MAITRKIFIVDSDTRFRCLLEESLEKTANTIVFPFYSAEECINVLETEPDVILVDLHMESRFRPVMSGLDLLAHVKTHHPNIDVIILSSDDSLKTSQHVSTFTPFDYVLKTEASMERINSILQIIFRHKAMEDNVQMYRNTAYLIGVFLSICMLSVGCAVVF